MGAPQLPLPHPLIDTSCACATCMCVMHAVRSKVPRISASSFQQTQSCTGLPPCTVHCVSSTYVGSPGFLARGLRPQHGYSDRMYVCKSDTETNIWRNPYTFLRTSFRPLHEALSGPSVSSLYSLSTFTFAVCVGCDAALPAPLEQQIFVCNPRAHTV